jgi:hypothetical protein
MASNQTGNCEKVAQLTGEMLKLNEIGQFHSKYHWREGGGVDARECDETCANIVLNHRDLVGVYHLANKSFMEFAAVAFSLHGDLHRCFMSMRLAHLNPTVTVWLHSLTRLERKPAQCD